MNKRLVLLIFLAICFLAAGCGASLVVDSVGDEPDADLNDGVCKTVNNDCTLRAAIMEANLSDDISKITFGSSMTISPATDLPPLTSGNTQILGGGKTIILDGSQNSDSPSAGIHILDSHNNTIQGLQIQNFFNGIYIQADEGESKNNIIGMAPTSTSGAGKHNVLVHNSIGLVIEGNLAMENLVSGNYIGVDSDGITPNPNDISGITIRSGANHNLIGSLTGNEVNTGGNLISGNDGPGVRIRDAVHNHLSGNTIGTDVSANNSLGNGDGVRLSHGANNNIIGLDLSGDGQPNLISGNNADGIWIENSDYTIIAGNTIGLNGTGTAALPNRFGVYLHHSDFNIIGTDGDGVNDANEGNLIGGNTMTGIIIKENNSIYNIIAGNRIGTTADGSGMIGNGESGVSTEGHSTRIGTNGDGVSDDLEGNLISGNGSTGIFLGSMDNIVAGNIIGLDLTGSSPIPNKAGITLNQDTSGNRIGTDGDGTADALEGNLISGNGVGSSYGIKIDGSDNTIAGNIIGPDVTGATALSDHQTGIRITSTGNNNLIGTDGDGSADQAEVNLISGNGLFGIQIEGGAYNRIAGNLIGTDLSGGSALPNGSLSGETYHGAVQLEDGSNNNIIGTNSDGGSDQLEGNLISGNAVTGIVIRGSNTFNNVVAGNRIGTDISGGSALGNAAGIDLMQGTEYTRIGTDGNGLYDLVEANLISGNGDFGVRVDSPSNIIQGNFIGTDFSGSADIGNGSHGILINNNGIGVGIGGSPEKANTIAFNGGAGIYLRKIFPNDPVDPTNVIITFNSIYDNDGEGIDLDDATSPGSTPNDPGDSDAGPNDFMNYPELSNASSIMSSVTITGEIVDGLPNSQFVIQFFSNPVCDAPSLHGEGKTYLGSSTQQTDGSGDVQFLVALPGMVPPGSFITATATNNGKTSEFSNCVEVADAQTYMEKADEEEEYPCDVFVVEEMALTTSYVDRVTGQFTLTIQTSFPFPGIMSELNLQYTADLGGIVAESCGHHGFEDRLICLFYLSEAYYNTRQPLLAFSNYCLEPIYSHEGVSILPGDEPLTCSGDLGPRACADAGGTYSAALGKCICP